MCVCVYPLTPLTHKHTHVQPQFLRGGRLRRLVHACFASLLKEYEDMSAAEPHSCPRIYFFDVTFFDALIVGEGDLEVRICDRVVDIVVDVDGIHKSLFLVLIDV